MKTSFILNQYKNNRFAYLKTKQYKIYEATIDIIKNSFPKKAKKTSDGEAFYTRRPITSVNLSF